VTILTSVAGDVTAEVLRYAKLGKDCGLDGAIASLHEVKMLRQWCGEEFLVVTPGIGAGR
jgi:orotidine-5'-phosphate decarboxylase